jgi:DeoR family transcriptional regulator, aga operon transcriptional repressor
MIAAQRRAQILEHIRREGGGSIVALADIIGASQSTIRRDLDSLVKAGFILRSRGGALLEETPRTAFEPEREIGAQVSRAAKRAIGARAALLVERGQSVIFDSSSTVLEAAKAVVKLRLDLTVCTNDIATAGVLASCESLHLLVLGGTKRAGSLTLSGDPGLTFLERLHTDIAFIGIHSLFGGRLSETSVEVAAIKRRMISSATRAIVLADSSKFRHPAFCDVAEAQAVRMVITDTGIGEAEMRRLTDIGVEVIAVEPLAD